MSELKRILNELVAERGRGTIKDLAKFLGTSEANVSRYLSNDGNNANLNMPSKMFEKTAKYFGIDESILIKADCRLAVANKIIKDPTNENTIDIPIIEGLAGCGASGMLEQLYKTDKKMVFDKRIFPQDIISKDMAMIRIVGDSMHPFLEENDWAMIQLRNGYDIVYADSVYLVAHGENVQIKRCHFMADGSCILISDNQLYPPEKAYAGEWDIVGKVVARVKMGSLMQLK